ncbi:MAG: DNA polymerase III subunit delta [Candidatus Aminicenantes bacterium]
MAEKLLLKDSFEEGSLKACYFFYGEETFLARQFVNTLKSVLIGPDDQDFCVERLNLKDQSWGDVLDSARTAPFLFSTRRLILVDLAGKREENLTAMEKKLLEEYFSSPSSRSILVIVFTGIIRRSSPLVRFFASLSSSVVHVEDIKPLRGVALFGWIDKRFEELGRAATADAKKRMVEVVGNDLGRLSNEIEKIDTYAIGKKVIEVDDVNEVSGWFKTYAEWEMTESLENADYEQCLRVMDNLFSEGTRPEYILGAIARFFRSILLAKLWLRENKKDKKEIFKELKPQIKEKFGSFYTSKFRQFFDMIESVSQRELTILLNELEKVDLAYKTSGLSLQTLLEGFLLEYCRLRHPSLGQR